jgi:transglutaminase-like putative cysteine protease
MAMRPPRLLLGAALLLWGWRAEAPVLAITLALLLELSPWVGWRWQLRDKDIYRIVDFCTVVLAGWVVYAIAFQGTTHAVIVVLQGLPVIVFPLVAVQRYGEREGLPLSALSLQQRRWGRSRRTVEVGYPYLAVCLIAASPGQHGAAAFFLAVVLLWFWALWPLRNPRHAAGAWLSLALLTSVGAYAINTGILQLQGYLEQQIPEWLLDWFDADRDPYRRSTALGAIGRLKLSDAIVMRVSIPQGEPGGRLLRTGSYNLFGGDAWYARSVDFTPLKAEEGENWPIRPTLENTGQGRVEIVQDLERGAGLLPLPLGAYRVDGIPAESVQRNGLGAVKVSRAPAFVRYRIAHDPLGETDLPPSGDDVQVPEQYREMLAEIVAKLNLRQQPRTAPARLIRFFNEQFVYSLDLSRMDAALPPLEDFLRNTRSGHCEYFATATVLLLRAAGIPARYAAGFSVQEYSALERRFVVRGNHAHSWALAYLDGRWRDVDTTPPVWITADAEQASRFGGVYDVLSWLWVQFKQWRLAQSQAPDNQLLAWWLAPLVLLLAWRLHRQQWVRKHRRPPRTTEPPPASWPGGDSECYRIMDWCRAQGRERRAGEPLRPWLARSLGGDEQRRILLDEILRLHYRYRFDPRGLDPARRQRLNALVRHWFEP